MQDPDALQAINHFDDFKVGQVFRHHWGRTISQAEAIEFVTQNLIHEPLYFNLCSAESAGHEKIPVHPLYIFSLTLGMSVEDLSESGGPFLGAEAIQSHKFVYPNDTLFASSRVQDTRLSSSRPGYGIVCWKTIALNQNQECVCSFQRTNLVRIRNIS